MAVSADVAAAALVADFEQFVGGVPGGWTRWLAGVLAAVTGVGAPTLNGVWTGGLDPDVAVVGDLLDEVAATGLPHCLQVRTGVDARLPALAAARGMDRSGAIPLMVLEDTDRLAGAQVVEGLSLRQVEPREVALHAALLARGFGAPEEHFRQLVTPESAAAPGVRCYVGEVGGDAVTTGLGATRDGHVGIFNIATPPEHRGRGYGAAVTARAVADGIADGAGWAYLQASPAGFPVYLRLGFSTVDHFDCWVVTG